MKKKRKIKVPAAKYGINGSNISALPNYAEIIQQQADTNNINNQLKLMNVSSILSNKNTNATSTTSNVNDIIDNAGSAIGFLGNMASGSDATNRRQALTQSLSDIASGAATGAKIGSLLGPVGGVVGGAVGAVTGLVGRKGREAEMTSFTDYDEGTLGTGLIGAFGNSRLRAERRRIKKNAYDNRAAVQGTANLQNEYAEEYGQMDTNTFAYGGITNKLAYVDDGELISTPDGQINKVPELGRPTDSNLVSLPEGSKILSDSLKVPGTNKTFAKLGEELMTTKKSKFNDIYAENAAKLNEMNNKSIHDQLFDIQEAVKAKKGIKRKYKNAVIAAEDGDETRGISQLPFLGFLKPVDEFLNKTFKSALDSGAELLNNSGAPIRIVKKSTPTTASSPTTVSSPVRTTRKTTTPATTTTITNNTSNSRKNSYGLTPYSNYTQVGMDYYGTDAAADYMTRREWTLHNQNDPRVQQLLKDINAGKYGNIGGNTLTWNDYVRLSMDGKRGPVHNAIMALQIPDNAIKIGTNGLPKLSPKDWIGEGSPYKPNPNGWRREWTSEDLPLPGSTVTSTVIEPKKRKDPNTDPIDWTGIASGIAGLSPIISNLMTTPEYEDPNYNPYANAIMRTMGGRRYNINPAIRDIQRNRAINNYNASQMNTNTGANLAFRLQNAVNTNRAIADLRAAESNMNNQYAADYANIMNSLGQQWANETTRVDTANMANRAAARNIRRAGLSGLSQWMQNRELMRNQRDRDNAMLALYEPFLQAGFTTQDMTNFRNWLRRANG